MPEAVVRVVDVYCYRQPEAPAFLIFRRADNVSYAGA